MFCSNCGTKITGSKKFCTSCGEKIVEESHDNIQYYNNYEPTKPVNGFSISGLIIGVVSIILAIILLVLVVSDHHLRIQGVVTYIVLGISSGVLSIIGLVLSIIGLSKLKDAFGIIGLVMSVITIILDFITLFYFLSLVLH